MDEIMRLFKRILPALVFLALSTPAPAHANWLTDSLHGAGSWLQDKGSALVSDSRDRMNSGNIFNKLLGVGERVVGELVKGVGRVVDWLSGHGRGRDAEALEFEPDPELGLPLPRGPDGKPLGPGEAVRAQRDIGGDGNGEARGTGGADGGQGEPEGQTDGDARWEPGQGGVHAGAVGTSRFGKKEMDFNATRTAADGMVIPGFSAGAVCTGAACGKGSGKPVSGQPSLGNLLTKADLPSGFGKGSAGGRGGMSTKGVNVAKSYEPALRAQGEAPPPAAPTEEEESWLSGLFGTVKNAVSSAGKAVLSVGKKVVEGAAALGREVVAAVQHQVLPQKDKNRPDFSGVGCKFLFFGCEGVPGAKYEEVEGKLFVQGNGEAGDITARDINQGQIGDCYLESSLAVLANKNPELLRKNIQDNGDGTYSVTLYQNRWWDPLGVFGKEAKTVTVDNQFPMRNGDPVMTGYGAGEDEIWVMVAEKAYAQESRNGSFNAMGNGGLPGTAMEALTGKKSGSHLAYFTSVQDMAEWDSQGRGIVAGTKPDVLTKNDPLFQSGKLVPGHAYWVETVDTENKTVTVANPWGWGYEHVTLTEDEFKHAFLTVYDNPLR